MARDGGSFTVELDTDTAPDTVNNFGFLARWNYYDWTTLSLDTPIDAEGIHEEQQTLQADGPPTGAGEPDAPGYEISSETPTDQTRYPPLSIIMDNGTQPNTSHGGRFFIVLDSTDPDSLGDDYTQFGKVIFGQDTIAEIEELGTSTISNVTVEAR